MSIDKLHNRIRKLKGPVVIDFSIQFQSMPPHLLQEEADPVSAYFRFCTELMNSLKDHAAAVRFSFDDFAMEGSDGLSRLQELTNYASELGFYVILDGPQILTPWAADRAAEKFFEMDTYSCDALQINPYIGSDALKPFLPICKERKKALIVSVRTPNKSAAELQDLLSGSRLVHVAAAELVNRYGEGIFGKCGYSTICASASCSAPDSLRTLRAKYTRVFLLVDGLDYPSGNAKNCSFAFDRFGYGAAVCVGPSVICAWKEEGSDGQDYLDLAVQAVERVKRNVMRYVTIL